MAWISSRMMKNDEIRCISNNDHRKEYKFATTSLSWRFTKRFESEFNRREGLVISRLS